MRAGNLVKFINPKYPDFIDAIGLLTTEKEKNGTKHFTVEWVTKITVSGGFVDSERIIVKSHFSEHSLEVIS